MNRRILLFLLLLSLGATSCKKVFDKVNDAREQAAIDLVTNGRWKMTEFYTGSTDQLYQFNGYLFQFNADQTVDAYQGNTLAMHGSFVYDLTARTITSSFPTTAEPLALLNGTFRVIDSGDNYVVAEMTVSGETRHLKMVKM